MEIGRLRDTELLLRHEHLRGEVSKYLVDHDGDPIELLKKFAERLRELIDCDQVIYRDLEETRIMVNSPEIADSWSVPIEFCRQCEHFDAHHPMYAGGYTEMDNCQEGWQGIPVYHECPIKSSLTRIVYCDGEVAGYLAIHYVQDYHNFTEIERITLEEFTRLLSISLSRFNAKQENKELRIINEIQGQLKEAYDKVNDVNRRNALLHKAVKASIWSYEINKNDEVVRAVYDDYAEDKTDKIINDSPMGWVNALHPEDKERVLNEFMSAIKDHSCNTPYETTYRLMSADGSYFWLKSSGRLNQNDDGTSELFGITVNITDEIEKERKQKEEVERALVFTNFFLDTYVSAYYVNLETFSCQIYKRTNELERDYSILTNYFDSINDYINREVHPEDREKLLDVVKPAKMKALLEERGEYTQIFRDISDGVEKIYRLQVIRGSEENHAAFGFIDITKEIQEQMKRQTEAEEAEKLIKSFAASYNFAYAVDMNSDTFRVIRLDDNILRGQKLFDKFSQVVDYLLTLMNDPDRSNMRHELDYNTIREKLTDINSYDVEYRTPVNGAMVWNIMNVTKIDENRVAIGFSGKDIEITKKHLEDMRYNEYFALYEVDIDSGLMKIIKDSPYYQIGRNSTAVNFREAMLKFAASLDDEPRSFFKQMADLEYVKMLYRDEDKSTYAYRSNNVGEKNWIDCTIYVTLRHSDGTPAMITFGFSILDSLGVYRQELQKKYVEQNAVLLSQQEELEIARNEADAANMAKTNFLFNMSHDIRTPMNAIRGFTTMAKKHADEPQKVKEYLNKIDVSGEHLLSLINQVLEMARIESGKVELEENPIDVINEYNAMVIVLAEQATAKGLIFNHSISGIKHKYVLADEARMGSVTLNLAGNAMKYTPEGGTVEFSLEEVPARKPGYATYVFTVADTGIGMSKEYLEKLYEPFSREKNSTVSRIQGTGLGLSIVKNIIDLMGGDINVNSELGRGTKFDITVDFRINKNTIEEIPKEDEVVDFNFDGRRVLLVEDNEMNREIARDILEEQGLLVEDAEDGDIAVEMVQKAVNRGDFTYYDFILMDVQMPRMNGYDATKAIRAIPGPEGVHIPIIAMTANAFEEDRKNALDSGMDEHLTKPIDVQKMFTTISKLL